MTVEETTVRVYQAWFRKRYRIVIERSSNKAVLMRSPWTRDRWGAQRFAKQLAAKLGVVEIDVPDWVERG